jgi:hypothetical protein
MPLTVQGTMKWRITNLQRFYLLVSKEIRAASDQRTSNRLPSPAAHTIQASQPVLLPASSGSHGPPHRVGGSATASRKLGAAETWLRYIAEEQTRAVVSRVNTGLLVAESGSAGRDGPPLPSPPLTAYRSFSIRPQTADLEFSIPSDRRPCPRTPRLGRRRTSFPLLSRSTDLRDHH